MPYFGSMVTWITGAQRQGIACKTKRWKWAWLVAGSVSRGEAGWSKFHTWLPSLLLSVAILTRFRFLYSAGHLVCSVGKWLKLTFGHTWKGKKTLKSRFILLKQCAIRLIFPAVQPAISPNSSHHQRFVLHVRRSAEPLQFSFRPVATVSACAAGVPAVMHTASYSGWGWALTTWLSNVLVLSRAPPWHSESSLSRTLLKCPWRHILKLRF